jgi:hypothetical protein
VDHDVVELTLTTLEGRQDWGPGWYQEEDRDAFLKGVRGSMAEWSEIGAGTLQTSRYQPLIELVQPVE